MPGAITNAKTLVEAVFKELLSQFGEDVTNNKDNLNALKKKVFEKLNMSTKNQAYDRSLISIISGLNTIIDSIAVIRNNAGTGHLAKSKAMQHHALLAVNSAKTVVGFIFQTYEYQKSKYTKIKEI